MKQLFCVLGMLAVLNGAAQREVNAEVSATAHWRRGDTTGFGAHLSAGVKMSPLFAAGLSVDVVKFRDHQRFEVPFAANLVLTPVKHFFLTLEPGYNLVSRKAFGAGVTAKGGFYGFGGVGYAVPGTGKIAPVITLGASRFSYARTEWAIAPNDGRYLRTTRFGRSMLTLRVGVRLN